MRTLTGIATSDIRKQLRKILASPNFAQTTRLSRFLQHVVDSTLSGETEQLKEYVLALSVFDRPDSFDPRLDPIVRVEAGRVRQKLERYYEGEGKSDSIRIELPKGSYAPTFQTREERRSVDAQGIDHPTIAVLPFADQSPTRNQAYFCEGITDELTRILTRIEGLHVYSPAGRSLSRLLLEGSVRREGEQLRITAKLLDRKTGRYLWSERYDRQFADVFSIQDEIARAIVETLQLQLSASPQPSPGPRVTSSATAYRLYLKARHHWNSRTGKGLHEGIRLFERALECDSDFAQAYAGLADSHTLLGNYGLLPPKTVRERARQAAEKAVELAPQLAEAHTSLAHVLATYEWKWAEAEREYELAIDLNPRLAIPHHWYAMTCLMPQRRLDEAQVEIKRALALDPVSVSIARDAGVICWSRREYDQARELAQQALNLDPGFHETYWVLGLICEQMCELKAAESSLLRGLEICATPRLMGALGHCQALMGKEEEARRRLFELQEMSEERYVSPFDRSVIYVALGEIDMALQWLRLSLEARCYEMVWLKVDPRYDRLRLEPEFQAIQRSVTG